MTEPEVPIALSHVWSWFWDELDPARSGSGFGMNPISYSEIRAWADLMGRSPTSTEISVLRAMDLARLSAIAKFVKGQSQ